MLYATMLCIIQSTNAKKCQVKDVNVKQEQTRERQKEKKIEDIVKELTK